ncbi:MAG: GIY-YIG nuclease family protein [Pseudomonadota bacterium]
MAHFVFIATYIMANQKNGAIYTGHTSNLPARVGRHKRGAGAVFTARNKCFRLVWYEQFDDIPIARKREKQIKRWPRRWKIKLIEKRNPAWLDLSCDLV